MMISSKLSIGQYYPINSPAHHLDARGKIIITILYMAALFTAQSLSAYIFLTVVFVVVLLVSRIPFTLLWRGMRMITIFIMISMLFNFFLVPGEIIWQWGFLKLTWEGLFKGLLIGWRLILLVFFASLLTLCTKPLDLTDALESLLKPLSRLGLPVHEFAMIVSIALRFIPTILQEFDRIVLAQKARGARFDGTSLGHKLQQLMPLLIPLFISAFRRADDLALAMDARCYQGGKGRSRWRVRKWQSKDSVVLLIFAIIFTLIIYGRIGGA
ncbi:MAG: energy-coupling factor transporter transmembrane component T family protein [Bacillota bacterium]|jgi:energy-coupling factor transport system permease protein